MRNYFLSFVLFFLNFILLYSQPVPIDYNGDTLWVHPTDNSTGIEWGAYGLDITAGNGADSDTNGYANTKAIVAEIDSGAAYLCDTLTAYGFDDWYLPAKAELNALWLDTAAIGGFSSTTYWSSTEGTNISAWNQHFGFGNQTSNYKYNYFRARCVRKSEQFNNLTILLDTIKHESTKSACDGEILISVNGGSGFYSYQWSNDSATQYLTGLCPGTYSVTVTDTFTLHTVADTLTINEGPLPFIIFYGDTLWVHPTDNSTSIEWGAYDLDITAGNGADSYTNGYANTKAIVAEIDSGAAYLCDTLTVYGFDDWYLPARDELNALWLDTAAIGGFSSTYYWSSTEYLSDYAWCQYFDDDGHQSSFFKNYGYRVRCVRRSKQFINLTITLDSIIHVTCHGGNDGEIHIHAEGGTPPYTYLWDNAIDTNHITNQSAGTYKITVTDDAGDTIRTMFDITQPDKILVGSQASNPDCYNDNTGDLMLNISNGIPPFSYIWNTGETTANISNLDAGIYKVTVTDSSGCKQTHSKAILQPGHIVIDAQITNIGCSGAGSGSINLYVSGGTPGYNYLWSNDSVTANITGLSTGSYDVSVSDNNGCLQTGTYTITTTETVNASAGNDKEICPGTEVSLTASGGDYYLWSTGDKTAKINVAPLVTTSYIVDVEKNGCRDKDTVTVIADSANCFTIDVDVQYTVCGHSDGSATLTITGGTAPFSILWSTGDTAMSITGYPAGNYNVQVKDALNNVLYKTFSINNTQGPTVNGSATDVACFNGNDGAIDLTVSGGATPYKYSWSTGAQTQDIQNIRAGYYEVAVEDDNGCLVFKEFEVNEPDPVTVQFIRTDASCSGDTGSLSADVSGGTVPYTYAWPNDSTGQKISGLSIGTYTVTVTDDNNCSVTATTGISGTDGPLVTVDSIVNTTCNDSTGEVYTLVSGGAKPYAFAWENGSADQHLYYASEGLHTLTVTDSNGCRGMVSAQVDEAVVAPPHICIVTTDSLTSHNLIAWQKEDNPGIAAYNIYKEVRANQYQLIGSVGETENSVFEDSLSNPMIRSYKYKIAAVDVCGNETMKSHTHKTIHLSLSSGFYENSVNLSWDNYGGFYYDAYQIARYSTSENWEILDVLPGSPEDVFNSYTDTDVPDDVKKYMVIIDKGDECVVTNKKANAGPFSQSLSNLEDNRLKGEEIMQTRMDLMELLVYPNPSSDMLNIEFSIEAMEHVNIEIYQLDGIKIETISSKILNPGKHSLKQNISSLLPGIYYLKLQTAKTAVIKKIVIQ